MKDTTPGSLDAETGGRVGRGNLSIFLASNARENFKLNRRRITHSNSAHVPCMALPLAMSVVCFNELGSPVIL